MAGTRLMERIWTRDTVIAAIHAEVAAGHELSYSRMTARVPSLLRAAERVFGSWGAAVEAAGYDYEAIRRYRKWTRKQVIERIQYWHGQKADLSWRYVAEILDPPLAAAALHGNRFASWNEALRAAGIDPDEVMRYRRWSVTRMRDELERLANRAYPLDRKSLAVKNPGLLAAVYRHGAGLVAERSLLELRQALGLASFEQRGNGQKPRARRFTRTLRTAEPESMPMVG